MPALAGPFEDSVAKFANDEFSDTEAAIGEVASSGNALAPRIIGALQDGRLSADPDSKKVFITQTDGKIIDAATGAVNWKHDVGKMVGSSPVARDGVVYVGAEDGYLYAFEI